MTSSPDAAAAVPRRRVHAGDPRWFPSRWGPPLWWATLLGFVTLTLLVVSSATLTSDLAVTRLVVANREEALTWLATAVSWAGSFPYVVLLSAGAAAVLDWRFATPWRCVSRVAVVLSADVVLVAAIKYLVDRPRPPEGQPLATVVTSSFPSGHATATTAVVAVLVLSVLAATRSGAARVGSAVGAALVVAAMGWSRVYLGVHYLADVAGGALLGVWLALSTAWLSGVVAGVPRDPPVARSTTTPRVTRRTRRARRR